MVRLSFPCLQPQAPRLSITPERVAALTPQVARTRVKVRLMVVQKEMHGSGDVVVSVVVDHTAVAAATPTFISRLVSVLYVHE